MSMSITEKTKKYSTDASPSWNGYNHQGKVGIFVVLKLINELKIDYDTCAIYELELEWLEDFSILKNGEYIALHQVKTYKETMPSKYKEAIWLLLAKTIDIPKIKNTYLHTTVPISNIDNLRESILAYKISEKVETEVDNEGQEKKKSKNYWTPKQCKDHVLNSGRYEEAFDKFSLFSYGQSCLHCSMDEIEEKIKFQIKTLYKGVVTEQQLDRTYLHLLGLLDRHIRERHRDIQIGKKDQKVPISFQEILKVVQKNYELLSREYCIYLLRHEFNNITNQYIEDLEEEYQYSDDNVNKENLNRLINAVLELDDESFFKFCMKITPHHPVNDDNPESLLEALRNYIPETHMTEGYLEILKQIQHKIDSIKHMFFQKGEDSQNISYLPTTIIESNSKPKVGRMVDKILQNSILVEESLHEVDVMITKSINLQSLKPEKINSDLPEVDGEPLSYNHSLNRIKIDHKDYHNRIVKIKKIRMIDLKTAKRELDK
ncbi:ABC-three component system protein [Bacillus sp. JJ1562]|uniref:ABC-three component system protein n=1 Tax=Bacillus sp. JJ1562 TaxID=3122960 RepID=UPI003001F60F